MKSVVLVLVANLFFSCSIFWSAPSSAHGWYPLECCQQGDCAPVESVERFVPTGGGAPQLLVTTKRGAILIPENFPGRESKDGQMHVCVRGNEYGRDDVMCFFMPPGM